MTKKRPVSRRPKPLFSHPKHSGKRLAHHHTHYLPLLFLVIFSGFVLLGITRKAQAASDIIVSAKVAAPLPSLPAVISSPLEGASFTHIPIDITGSCPASNLVKIYRNSFFSGSVICAIDGTFTLQSDLFVGANELEAKIYNITDDEGPLSTRVNVTYTPPVPVINPETGTPETVTEEEGTSVPDPDVPQFIVKAENTYKGYTVGQKIEWELEAIGGIAPYAFNIEWGDGRSTVVSRKTAGKFKVNHTYDAQSMNSSSYTIRIRGSDQAGGEAFVQLVVLVSAPYGITSVNPSNTTASINPLRTVPPATIAWVTYSGVLAMVASFWFGQFWSAHHAVSSLNNRKIRLKRL